MCEDKEYVDWEPKEDDDNKIIQEIIKNNTNIPRRRVLF
nr:MAG: hypothetical protein [Bacteriophage sp.]